jgi:hypothetical protein
MPVSKKRKKEGKPVQRSAPPAAGEAHAHGPEVKVDVTRPQGGKPSNPFVAQQQARRGAQRGR